MTQPELVVSTPDAPWLPPGSTAEVWAGRDLAVPEPSIIVRILLTRPAIDAEPARFFCVETAKGLDLPTRFLGRDGERQSASQGLAELAAEVLGTSLEKPCCVGWVRNHVPQPDDSYPHPTPDAFVPVFEVVDASPKLPGEWVTAEQAEPELAQRHWWPILRCVLGE